MIAEPKTVADHRPGGSALASREIPITNAAGLLQCGPAATDQALTKPRDGALDLRAAQPDRINFIRTAPSDDIQGPALAAFVYRDLGAKRTLVIDDGDAGREIADGFSAAYQKIGGKVVHRTLNKGADPASVLDPLTGPDAPLGGVLRRVHRHRCAGGPEGHGAPGTARSRSSAGTGSRAGPAPTRFVPPGGRTGRRGSYYSHASFAPPKADFVERYRARFGASPTSTRRPPTPAPR